MSDFQLSMGTIKIDLPINLSFECFTKTATNLYQMTKTGVSAGAFCTAALDIACGGFIIPKAAHIGCNMISRATGFKSDLLYVPAMLTSQAFYGTAKNKIFNETTNSFGETHLIMAARTCHVFLVNACIQAGADLDAKTDDNDTALFLAVAKGNFDIVNTLIQAGADVNTENNYGFTPLLMAAGRGYTKIVNVLIQAGADIEFFDSQGNTPLFYAMLHKHAHTIELLNRAKENQETPKFRSDMFDILKSLVQDQPNPPGCTTFLDLPMEIRMLILSKRDYPEWYKPCINRDLYFAANKVNKMLTNRQEQREESLEEIGFNFLFNL